MNLEPFIALGNIAVVLTLGWLTPGPNMLAVISASVNNGRKSGIAIGAGLAFGGALWALLAVTGISALFELFPNLFFLLRMAGAGYLIWLGIKMLKNQKSTDGGYPTDSRLELHGWKAFRTGFLVTATNPKAALFFGSVLTAFVPINAPMWLLVSIVVLCWVQGMLGHLITATVFSTAAVVKKIQTAGNAIDMVFGVVFGAFGFGVAYDAIKRL